VQKRLIIEVVKNKWMHAGRINTKLRERDGIGGYNSIVYCGNHRFELKRYKDAHNVVVTGNFYITGS